MTITDALATILSGRIVEFTYRDSAYLIQQENNKGYNYLSIWRTAPDYVCLDRVFFDIEDGLDEETVQALLTGKCIDGMSAADILSREDDHPKVKRIELGLNPGETTLVLRDLW